MTTQADKIAEALRPIAPGGKITAADVPLINQLGAGWEARLAVAPLAGPPVATITAPIALEIVGHEAIVLEEYKDSVGVWTWGVGVTSRSGHDVDRYRDKPQTIEHCLGVYIWLLRTHYLPDVLAAFKGFPLSEAQLAAALSFHYNTGAIMRADWVADVKAGRLNDGRTHFMNYSSPPSIVERRELERDLFFEGKWSNDGTALVVPVSKPSYHPNFRAAKRVDIRAAVAAALVEA